MNKPTVNTTHPKDNRPTPSTLALSPGAVVFTFSNGNSAHIRQGPDGTASVVASDVRDWGFNPECECFEYRLGALKSWELTLTVEELVEFLKQLGRTE